MRNVLIFRGMPSFHVYIYRKRLKSNDGSFPPWNVKSASCRWLREDRQGDGLPRTAYKYRVSRRAIVSDALFRIRKSMVWKTVAKRWSHRWLWCPTSLSRFLFSYTDHFIVYLYNEILEKIEIVSRKTNESVQFRLEIGQLGFESMAPWRADFHVYMYGTMWTPLFALVFPLSLF